MGIDDGSELRRVAERLRVLSEASKEFAAATGEPAVLLDMVTRRVSETIGDLAVIRLVDDADRLLEAGGSAHHPDPAIVAVVREVMAAPQPLGVGLSGRVVATGEPVTLSAPSAEAFADGGDPRFRAATLRIGTCSLLAVPLLARNRVIGVLTLTRSTPGKPYTAEDVQFTQDLATHAALAIKTSRLLASMQRELVERQRAEDALLRTEEQLRHSQKVEAVGRLAGGVAHDFNNLLSVILSYSSFMKDALEPDHPLQGDIQEIRIAGERAAELTRQLLAFSRQQVVDAQILDVNDVIGELERMVRRILGEDVALRISRSPELGKVKADPGHLEQVVMNLVVNARDAMARGGTLTIETANVDLDEAYAAEHLGSAAGPHVMLAISDTGSGMDKATRDRIFEPFFTTKDKAKGTGLGLSTVFGIVKQNGGSIWVYSEVGRGTTFKIYLPRTDEAAPAPVTTSELRTLRGGETILLVEDDDQVRAVARGILQRSGYVLIEARDGADALRLCELNRGPIDLMLTDVVMPEMSGRELAEKIHVLRPGLKVLYMSGYTDEAILHHRALVPGIALLQKPLTPEALLRRVRSILDA